MSATTTTMNSHSAAALHARLQAGTRSAREAAVAPAAPRPGKKPHVSEAEMWRLMSSLHPNAALAEPTLSRDRALRRILSLLLKDSARGAQPVPLRTYAEPILIVRSGPWPLLRGLVTHMSALGAVPPLTVLCHRRDAATLDELARATGLPIQPILYPRFGPYNPVTVRRLIDADRGRWAAAFILDGSPGGTGADLEHIRMGLMTVGGDKYVWNASGQLFRLRSLRDTLGRENYETVRRLLRWRATQPADE